VLHGLQAGFGGLLGVELLEKLKGFGYQLLRVEQGVTLDDTRAIASEVLSVGMTPLVILFQPEHAAVLPSGSWAEAENEPDLAYASRTIAPRLRMPHADYITLTHRIAERADPSIRLWAGACSNPNARGRAYMEAVCPHFQARYGHSWHRYPHGGADATFSTPQDGFARRGAEVAYMRRLAGDRPLIISEAGYHTAPRTTRRWWGRTRSARWSPDNVTALWAPEWAFWRAARVEACVRYQLNSGPHPDAALDCYGIRDVNGLFVPSAPVALQETS